VYGSAREALRQALARKDLADKREAMLVPWRVVIAKEGLLVTLRKALRDSSRPQTQKDIFPPGLGNVFTDLLVAELAIASYKLTAACRNGTTYDRMKNQVRIISVCRARCCSCHIPPVCKYRRQCAM
jgi:hypothetical protein